MRMSHFCAPAMGALALLVLSACAQPEGVHEENVWVGAWASSQQIPEPHNALPVEDMHDATLRQIVRLSRGGSAVRVRVSNAFGTAPLLFEEVRVARAIAPGEPGIIEGSEVAATFMGAGSVIVPAGAIYISDPIEMEAAAFDDLAISIYLPEAPAQQTSHPGSRTTSFYLHGNHVSAVDLPEAARVDHWFQISGVDVEAPAGAEAIVIFGDSITDGRGSTHNHNDRWPDFLMRRLQSNPETSHLSVLNHGIGGNRVLDDGLAENAMARFERDVLAQPGVKHLIILEGVNDLGVLGRADDETAADFALMTARLIGAYDQMITRAHGHGIRVYGGTILPHGGSDYYQSSAESEAARNAVNDWIRNSGRFDGVFDFDALMRNPDDPTRMLETFDIGDGLHPSPAGFEAMAETVPLELFLAD